MLSVVARRAPIVAVVAGLLLAGTGCSTHTAESAPSKEALERCQELLEKQVEYEIAESAQLPGATKQVVKEAEIIETAPLTCEVSVEITDVMLGAHSSGRATIADAPNKDNGAPVTITPIGDFESVEGVVETEPRFDAVSTAVGHEQVAELFKQETDEYPANGEALTSAAKGLGADMYYGNSRFFTYKVKKYKAAKNGVDVCVVNKKDGSWAWIKRDGNLAGYGDEDSKPCTNNVDPPKQKIKESSK